MSNTVDRLARSDAVCIVGVDIVVKGLKLTSLFPSQRMTEIRDWVSVDIIISYLPLFVNKNSAPNADSKESTLSAKKKSNNQL